MSFGPNEYFLVIQGPEGQALTRLVLDYLEQLHDTSEGVAIRMGE